MNRKGAPEIEICSVSIDYYYYYYNTTVTPSQLLTRDPVLGAFAMGLG